MTRRRKVYCRLRFYYPERLSTGKCIAAFMLGVALALAFAVCTR